MLWFPRSFKLSNRMRKVGTVMKRHKLCDDVTLMSQRKLDNLQSNSPGQHVRVMNTPLPHFYTVKLGYTRVYFFLIFALKH